MASIEQGPIAPGLVNRVKGIIAAPRAEWDRIDLEPATQKTLFTGYACVLAAIGPVARLIGSQVVGYQALWMHFHPTLSGAIAQAIASYLMALASVYILAIVIDALAPTFGGVRSRTQALKVAVYSATPGWVAGIVLLIPSLVILVFLAGIYGLYLLYLGLPRVMKAPRDNVLTYALAVILAACVIYVIGAMVSGAVVDALGGLGDGAGGTFSGQPSPT